MQLNEKEITADLAPDDKEKLLEQAFDDIMELTREEKKELLFMWNRRIVCSKQDLL